MLRYGNRDLHSERPENLEYTLYARRRFALLQFDEEAQAGTSSHGQVLLRNAEAFAFGPDGIPELGTIGYRCHIPDWEYLMVFISCHAKYVRSGTFPGESVERSQYVPDRE